jgi:thiamine monophosphate synthase
MCAPPGAIAVQLREKDLAARELYELALALRERCSRYGAPLLISDRIDVAIAAGADGIHLPANSFATADARALLGRSGLVGVSTHQPSEVAAAAGADADFVVFGPVYALGGITAERVRELGGAAPAERRPAGIAVIGAVFGSEDAAKAIRELLEALAEW